MPLNPFQIAPAVTLAATTVSSSVALTGYGQQIRIVNPAGGADCFINAGDSTVVATVAAGLLIRVNSEHIFTVGSATHIAGVTSTGTASLNIVRSSGN